MKRDISQCAPVQGVHKRIPQPGSISPGECSKTDGCARTITEQTPQPYGESVRPFVSIPGFNPPLDPIWMMRILEL